MHALLRRCDPVIFLLNLNLSMETIVKLDFETVYLCSLFSMVILLLVHCCLLFHAHSKRNRMKLSMLVQFRCASTVNVQTSVQAMLHAQ